MAKIYKNTKEFLIIQINVEEATKLNFGFPITGLTNICVCGTCNIECKADNIYYVSCLNEIMCKECVDDYIENMNHFIDDDSLNYEINHFNDIAYKIDIKERACETPNGQLIIYDSSIVDRKHYPYARTLT